MEVEGLRGETNDVDAARGCRPDTAASARSEIERPVGEVVGVTEDGHLRAKAGQKGGDLDRAAQADARGPDTHHDPANARIVRETLHLPDEVAHRGSPTPETEQASRRLLRQALGEVEYRDPWPGLAGPMRALAVRRSAWPAVTRRKGGERNEREDGASAPHSPAAL